MEAWSPWPEVGKDLLVGKHKSCFSGSLGDHQPVPAPSSPVSAQLKPQLQFLPLWNLGVGKLLLQMATE